VNWRRARFGEEVLEGLTGVGLSLAACFGRRGMPVRGSSGGCGGRLGVRGGAWLWWEAHRRRGGLDSSWMRRSSMRWPWKRCWVAVASELFADCSRGGGSGRDRVGVVLRRTRALPDAVHQR
jgi:hypothetical protein